MSSSSNSGKSAIQSGPFSAMPFEQHLLNPGADALRKERRALLPEARWLLLRAAAASFDFGPSKGVVTRALDFLDSERSDDLPDAQLADRLEAIRQTLDDIRLSLETLETEKIHRVTGHWGQSGPGSGANQQMGRDIIMSGRFLQVNFDEEKQVEPDVHEMIDMFHQGQTATRPMSR
jgi:hypothetical protein